jgi:hypothetical protein
MSKVTFHGGCVPCESQNIYGLGRCARCCYMEANWRLPDLSMSPQLEKERKERAEARAKAKSLKSKFDAHGELR